MLTFAQAARISKDPLLAAVFKSAFTVDKFFAMLPAAEVAGRGLVYSREGTQISAGFIDAGGSLTATQQTFKEVAARLRTLGVSVELAGPVARNMNANLDQVAVQLAAAGRAFARKLQEKIWTGTFASVSFTLGGVALATGGAGPYLREGTGSIKCRVSGSNKYLSFRGAEDVTYGDESVDVASGNPTVTLTSADGTQSITVNVTSASLPASTTVADVTVSSSSYEFDGIVKACTNTTTGSTASGDAISFALLRQLLDAVDTSAGQVVLVANPRTIRSIKTLYDASGGITPNMVSLRNYGIDEQVLAFEGYPILPCQYISTAETKGATSTCTSVYAVSLAPATGAPSTAPFRANGVALLHGAGGQSVTGDDGPSMGVTIKRDDMPRDGDGKLKDSGEVALLGDYAVAVYSEKAVGRLYGITN